MDEPQEERPRPKKVPTSMLCGRAKVKHSDTHCAVHEGWRVRGSRGEGRLETVTSSLRRGHEQCVLVKRAKTATAGQQ